MENLESKILTTTATPGYELLDSGESGKLERYGDVVIARPDPQALWSKSRSQADWDKAQAYFAHEAVNAAWQKLEGLPDRWVVEFGGLKFWLKLSPFKHTGLFPEQESNWRWLRETIEKAPKPFKVLNLFGYTGAASLACVQAGAEVTHVDASKSAVTWTKDNAELSGLDEKPLRYITEDARSFVKRELKRGVLYDGLIMDPPAFGRGAKQEVWKIEADFLPLWQDCQKILAPDCRLVLLNGYAAGYSPLMLSHNLSVMTEKFGGELEFGELTIQESGALKRLLPAGIFARWRN